MLQKRYFMKKLIYLRLALMKGHNFSRNFLIGAKLFDNNRTRLTYFWSLHFDEKQMFVVRAAIAISLRFHGQYLSDTGAEKSI